jgi:hypothetical protein
MLNKITEENQDFESSIIKRTTILSDYCDNIEEENIEPPDNDP